MPHDANIKIFAVFNVFHSYARRSIMLARAHALQRVNVAPLAMLDHAHAPSHVNNLYVYLQIQIYNEDRIRSWSWETSSTLFLVEIEPNRPVPTRKEPNFTKVF